MKIIMTWVVIFAILIIGGTYTSSSAQGNWRAACSNDVGQLAAQVGNASQIVVVDRPHAQSDSAMMATSRMCVLFK